MSGLKNNIVEIKQKQLKDKKAQNEKLVESIKQLKLQIQTIKWRIPEMGEENQIQNLKNSIRIPAFVETSQDNIIEKITQVEDNKCNQQSKKLLIKFLEAKKQMLQKIDKLKIDGNLYNSHKRVIYKEYLEDIRQKLGIEKQKNEKLQGSAFDLQKLKVEYEQLFSQIKKATGELRLSF